MVLLGYVILGILAGITAGLLGLGGGTILIPALILVFHFSQHSAQGTALAVMPLGVLAAVYQYHRHGEIDWKAAAVLTAGFIAGAYFTGGAANKIPAETLRKIFGLFLAFIAGKMLIGKGEAQNWPWFATGLIFFGGGWGFQKWWTRRNRAEKAKRDRQNSDGGEKVD